MDDVRKTINVYDILLDWQDIYNTNQLNMIMNIAGIVCKCLPLQRKSQVYINVLILICYHLYHSGLI